MTAARQDEGRATRIPSPRPAPGLLSRQEELAVWESVLADCRRGGAGAVVLLTGEAGIGKSRLVEEVLGAGTGPVHLLQGACPPVAGSELPFAAVLQGLRGLARTLPPPQRAVLTGWPDRGGTHSARSGQVRLFEELLGALLGLAEQRPVVMVVEDLHWADRSTLQLLAFLATNVRPERVVLLLSARDDLPRGHPLWPWLTEVSQLPHTSRLPLRRLTRSETAVLAQRVLGREPEPALLDAVFARSEGNPLFVELLLAEVRSGGSGASPAALPPLLRDLLAARLGTLGEPARHVLRIAATVGRSVPDALLAAVADLGQDACDRALHELVDRRVLRPDPGGDGYVFGHELLREAAYAELLPGERRRLHARLARLLAAPGGRSAPGEVAHHFLLAGDVAAALPHTVAAALAASQACAFAEALALFLSADELWPQVAGAARLTPLSRPDVLAAAARAADQLGDDGQAIALARRALAVLDGADDVRRAGLHERCGTYCFNAGDVAEAEREYLAALALLPADPPSAARAGVLAGLAMLHMAGTRLDEASAAARESIAVAQAAGALREQGRARAALGVVLAWQGDLADGVAELRQAALTAREVQDPDDLALATINLGHVLGVAGRYDEAARVSLEGWESARRAGLEREHGSFLLANAADALLKAGRWTQAAGLLEQARERGPRGLRAFSGLVHSTLLATRRGQHAEAEQHLQAARALLADSGGGQLSWQRELLEVAAELYAWSGQPEAAADAVDRGMTLTEQVGEPRTAGPLVASGLRVAADEAERARARRDSAGLAAAVARGEALHARGRRLDPSPLLPGLAGLPESVVLHEVCAGELGRLRGEPDAAPWRRAAAAWRDLGRPFEAAYASWRAAQALLEQGRSDDGAEPLREAYALATGLGATTLVEEVLALAKGQRIALEVLEPAPTQAAERQLGLTARELEVLTRVTAGQTNRVIAEELFISVKTASVHVSNILRKLEVPRRQDAARIGLQLGLVPHARSG